VICGGGVIWCEVVVRLVTLGGGVIWSKGTRTMFCFNLIFFFNLLINNQGSKDRHPATKKLFY
jgi:hypothetical protein